MKTTLSGFDASFLASETASTPMHTLKVIVLERDPNFRRPTRTWIREGLRRAVDALPALRVRPRPAPFGLGHPSWEEVPVDVDQHLRFETLWPLGARTVEDAIAEHVQDLLPRDRPLFDVLVVERADPRRSPWR